MGGFERETGRRISDELPNEENEAIIELYLIASGYPPEPSDGNTLTKTEPIVTGPNPIIGAPEGRVSGLPSQ